MTTVQAGLTYYKQVNEQIRAAQDSEITVENVIGQRAWRAFGARIHFPYSIFNYKIGPDPSSISLVMDLITTV